MQDSILVPHKAVMFSREGTANVMIVNSDNKVEQRQIEVKQSIGHNWLVYEGLWGGEKSYCRRFTEGECGCTGRNRS